MNKKVKNIIMIIIIILSIISIILTVCLAKGKNSSKQERVITRNEWSFSNRHEKPDGGNFPGEPLAMPNEGDFQGDRPEMAEGGEPPEMPNGGDFQGEPPEKPDGYPQGMSNNNSTCNGLSVGFYLLIGVESLVLVASSTYLVMSNCNKKTVKETLSENNKIIYIIVVIALTGCLTMGIDFITNNCLICNKSDSNEVGGPPNQGGSNSNINYKGVKEITETTSINNESFTSEESDENSILIDGDIEVDLSNITVSKTGDSDGGDDTSFYGINSAIIAKGGAIVNISNANITTDAKGANGVFSYGGSATTNNSNTDGTIVNISNSTITTTKDNSGGIMTTGGGTTNAKNLIITTSGKSSAAIRSDRGGGVVSVDGGTYTSNGVGSPAIYSTADITVKNATLVSTISEGAIIEGKNSITLENVNLTDSHTQNVRSKTYKNVFIYQSMSGDAKEGEATFTSKNSTITTNNGDSFYVSNTSAVINLENNTIINNDSNGYFLRAQKDAWGNEGSNGGLVKLNMTNQSVVGNIGVDSISTLTLTMSDESYLEGIINGENEAKEIVLNLDTTSKIKLTGDSYVTELNNSDTTNSNIDLNGYKLYVNGKAI